MIVKCLPWMHDFRPVSSLVIEHYEGHDTDGKLPVRFSTEVYDRCWRCPKLRTRTLKGKWSRRAIGLPGES